MDSFTVTAYDVNTQVVTLNATLVARPGYAGETLTALRLKNPPIDTVDNVKAFFRSYADAYIAGKISESRAKAAISSEVAALLNVATSF
jgi:hypothetical protein